MNEKLYNIQMRWGNIANTLYYTIVCYAFSWRILLFVQEFTSLLASSQPKRLPFDLIWNIKDCMNMSWCLRFCLYMQAIFRYMVELLIKIKMPRLKSYRLSDRHKGFSQSTTENSFWMFYNFFFVVVYFIMETVSLFQDLLKQSALFFLHSFISFRFVRCNVAAHTRTHCIHLKMFNLLKVKQKHKRTNNHFL